MPAPYFYFCVDVYQGDDAVRYIVLAQSEQDAHDFTHTELNNPNSELFLQGDSIKDVDFTKGDRTEVRAAARDDLEVAGWVEFIPEYIRL